jgi:hypothetical protein
MLDRLTKFISGLAVAGVLITGQVHGALGDITVVVPKTAYIEWIATAGTTMTNVDGPGTYAFTAYVGGAVTQLTQPADEDMFLGVMCNSLAGYDVTLTASNAGATATTGVMTIAGGTSLTYTGTLAKEAATFTAGTTASTSLDLTGATVSGTSVHTAEADLPLAAASPNVWKLTMSLPVISTVADGLIMSGTYAGGVTATIALK